MAPAAQALEAVLARLLPVALDFLARTFGLDQLPRLLRLGLEALRRPIDKGIDWVLGKIVRLAKNAGKGVKQGGAAAAQAGQQAVGTQPDNRTLAQKQQALVQGLATGTALLRDEHLSEVTLLARLRQVQQQQQLTVLKVVHDRSTDDTEIVHLHGEINPQQDGPKIARKKGLPKLALKDRIQLWQAGTWSADYLKLTQLPQPSTQATYQASGSIAGVARIELLTLETYGTNWRKYHPYKEGEAWAAIRALDYWTQCKDARQALNYRHHRQFNNPVSKDWHHIHEQSNGGAHSVKNLGLVDSDLNRNALNNYFRQRYPFTGGLTLREYLKGKSADENRQRGLVALRDLGLTLHQRTGTDSLPYQEITR